MPKLVVLAKYLQPRGPGELEWVKRVVLKMEPRIMGHFNWSFLTPTVYTFLELFCLFVLDPGEMPKGHSKSSQTIFTRQNNHVVRRYSIEVADTLLEGKFVIS